MDYQDFPDAWPTMAEREWIEQATAEALQAVGAISQWDVTAEVGPERRPCVVHLGVGEKGISLWASAAGMARWPEVRARLIGVDTAERVIEGLGAEMIRGNSPMVGVQWSEPVAFLFVDADHEQAGVLADMLAWLRHLAPGGIVAFHDYGNHLLSWCKGVKAAVDAWTWAGWEEVAAADSIRAFRRR